MLSEAKKVLIAVDYFPNALKVAETGFSFAKDMKSEVTIVHILSDTTFYSSIEYSPITGFSGIMEMNSQNQIGSVDIHKAALEFLECIKKHLGESNIHVLVKEGDLADTILETATDIGADLIVIGSHSRSWIENVVMGSVTGKVISMSQIPLMIVPLRKNNK